ncbi:MAG TPA: hypothetical protein VGQ69_13935 [Gemmatimonadales bacterium]|jgi:hypothetical protein|nr:hypothetical protein [Gemmatimonadales bacterium]HEV8600454.1 hypothetical protein [Gemmatimonadales bacterium]
MSKPARLGLLTLGLAIAACGGESQNPTPSGDLLVNYFQSGPEAGAVLLTITGGPVDNVTALGGQQVSFASPFTGTTKLVVAGTLSNGDILRLRVPDTSKFADYTVRIEQVADKNTFALIDPSSYTFTVHR